MVTPRPLWRWWLWCAVLPIAWRTDWRWAWRLYGWCVLPQWLASEEELAAMAAGDIEREDPW